MKKPLFALIASVVIVAVSCKKDSNNASGSNSNIVGKWSIEKTVSAITISGVTEMDTAYVANEATCYQDDFIEFKSDKTGYSSNGTNLCDSTQVSMPSSFQYDLSADGKTLSLTSGGNKQSLNITTLSSTIMVWSTSNAAAGMTVKADIYYRKL